MDKPKTNILTPNLIKNDVTTNSDHNNITSQGLDLDKLAKAVSIAETSGCTKGYGLTHNNCHGIKKGSIVKCSTKKGSKMCAFSTTQESFEAFKKIWQIGYKSKFPNLAIANTWTGRDSAKTWLNHVLISYYQ